jgi:hypothetical protein
LSFLLILKMKIKLFIILLILSCSFACKKNQDENTTDTPIEQLLQENTPESTVKSWQYFMDNNDFDQAKEIANEEAKEFLNEIKHFVLNTPEDTIKSKSQFLKLKCTEAVERATCITTIKDLSFDETYLDTFQLVYKDSKWLIALDESSK